MLEISSYKVAQIILMARELNRAEGELRAFIENLLPEEQVIGSIDTLFEQPGTHRCLEIGFGGGEHIIHRLSTQKERCYVGVEPFVNAMAKAVAAAQRANVTDRLRLWDQDAALLLDRLPSGSKAAS